MHGIKIGKWILHVDPNSAMELIKGTNFLNGEWGAGDHGIRLE